MYKMCVCVTFHTFVKLRKGKAEGRRRQTLCDNRDKNSVWKQFPPNFTFRLKDLFVKDQNTVVLIEHQHKHAGNRPVTFVTHKRFAVLFFTLSGCVSLLNSVLYARKSNCVRENYPTVEIHLKIDARCQSQRSSSIIDQERVDYISIQVPWLSTCGSTAPSSRPLANLYSRFPQISSLDEFPHLIYTSRHKTYL